MNCRGGSTDSPYQSVSCAFDIHSEGEEIQFENPTIYHHSQTSPNWTLCYFVYYLFNITLSFTFRSVEWYLLQSEERSFGSEVMKDPIAYSRFRFFLSGRQVLSYLSRTSFANTETALS
jgi:hypothetical protein